MSAFGYYEKDEVVEAIGMLAKQERERGKTPREIVESIMEATTYGINTALYELRDEKVDTN